MKVFDRLIYLFLDANVCNTSVTHKICTVVPTNRDTPVDTKGYTCTCMPGYTNNSAEICQGFSLFGIEKKDSD